MGRYNRATVGVTVMLLVGLGVAACGSDDDSSADSQDSASMSEFDAVPAESERASEGLDATSSDDAAEAGDTEPAGTGGGSIGALPGRAIATTAGVTVLTTDVRTAVDDTLTAVERNGGLVFTADVNLGDERDDGSVDGSGYFVVKVPPGDLELLIADLDATVGELAGRTQDSADVTDQLVDLDIRIGVERDIIDRFRALLGDATELADIIEIERVISERTIALEQLLASESNLENRVEFSTLTIELLYSPTVVEADESDDGIADALRTGWDGFVGVLFAIGLLLAVTAPFIVTGLVLGAIAWLVVRRWRARQTARVLSNAPAPPAAAAQVAADGDATAATGVGGQEPAEPSRPG